MKTPNFLLFISLVILPCLCTASFNKGVDDFLGCLSRCSSNTTSIFDVVYTPNNSSYSSLLQSSIRNLRFASISTPKPLVIVTPVDEFQIQVVLLCSRENGMQTRTLSGGHDYEGLSFTSPVPFVVIDLINLSGLNINVERKTAWVQSGATIGQLYYAISERSKTLAFPAGTCPTVAAGGHFSGGGYGTLLRKYGLAADNVIDARLIDANGNILDRRSMGKELFWAIRGGGGASLGIITAWKLKLVDVPEKVTLSLVTRTLEQNATELVNQWQYIAPNLPKDLYVGVRLQKVNSSQTGERTIQATFESLFLGGADGLVELMNDRFPELGLNREDCSEINWVQSVLSFAGYSVVESPQVLASRVPLFSLNFKAKSDYVQEPISENGLRGLWKLLYEREGDTAFVLFTPYGGRMKEISESAIPFPHRRGNLYKIQHMAFWVEPGDEVSHRHISWIRRLYAYMEPYVSKSPRSAYVNYRDLDLGVNNVGDMSYAQASVWGMKYFKRNFNRLVRVKTMVDPGNFFRNEQSIPPFAMG